MSPSEALSSSTDFPVFPVIRFPSSADFATGRGGLLQLLSMSLPSCCRYHPARVARRLSQLATIHATFSYGCVLCLWGGLLSGPPLRSRSFPPHCSLSFPTFLVHRVPH